MMQLSPSRAIKSVAGYALLPGFWDRLVGMVPRLYLLAYYMAVVFEMVRLLPKGHPVLNPETMQNYRIRDVMAAAANNLGGGWKNSDQYLVFGLFFVGIVALMVQFLLVATLITIGTAEAAGINFINIFTTPQPAIDIAHLMLDRVFGIPGFFNSCFDPVIKASIGAACDGFTPTASFPSPFQKAMQWMFEFYSFGMLAVAGFMVVYYIFAMIAETVNTGQPFGKRFQSFYTPVRLVLAILLMLPLAYGYNTGQYMVLWAAKWGSGMGTNAWHLFNNRAGDNPLGLEPQQLVAEPQIPDVESIINFFYLAHTCKASYKMAYLSEDDAVNIAQNGVANGKNIQAYFVRPVGVNGNSAAQVVGPGTTFYQARDFYGQGDIKIVFGEQNDNFTKYPAGVKPYCGEITIPTLSKAVSGIDEVYNAYFTWIMGLWYYADFIAYGEKMACNWKFADKAYCLNVPAPSIAWGAPDTSLAGADFYMNLRMERQADFAATMQAAITTVRTTPNLETQMDAKILLYGWGGAGAWFSKLASFNSAFVDALMILPTPSSYPLIMEIVAKKKKSIEPNTDTLERFSPKTKADSSNMTLDKMIDDADLEQKDTDIALATLLSDVYKTVQKSDATAKPQANEPQNAVKSLITYLFGHTGLFNFQANGEVFPLAKLTMLGREIIDKTLLMLMAGGIMTGAGGLFGASADDQQSKAVSSVISFFGKTLFSFATMGILAGIILNYMVPLMPFIYFFFAVGRWVKSIFEAMVAIPLWALAHLRLGGEGVPGAAAANGYFLILEIMIRPIMTVFGLLMSVAVFAAMSVGLDSIFSLAVLNAGGFDMTTLSNGNADDFAASARNGIDALFYTIFYAVLVYMMANSSFKLIDILPNSVMRWAGVGVSSFNDKAEVEAQMDRVLVYKTQQIVDTLSHGGASMATKLNTANLMR